MKNTAKRIMSIFMAALILTAALVIPAYADNITLRISSTQTMEVDKNNSAQINYYTDADKTTKVGSVQVKMENSYVNLTPSMDGKTAVYELDGNVTVELLPAANYREPDSYDFGGNQLPLFTTSFNLTLSDGKANELSFDFVKNQSGPIFNDCFGGAGLKADSYSKGTSYTFDAAE